MSEGSTGGGKESRLWVRGGEGGLPPAIAPFSLGVKAGPFVFTAGQASVDAERNVVGVGDIRAQTEQTIRNVAAVLERCGATLDDVVKMTIWIRDMNDYKAMNEIYGRWFTEPEPVRSCIRSELVWPELLVEMEATALVAEG